MILFSFLLHWHLWLQRMLDRGLGGHVGNWNPWSMRDPSCNFYRLQVSVFIGVTGSDLDLLESGHACSGLRVVCLSEAVAALCRPELSQSHFGDSLVCPVGAFYVRTLRWGQGWLRCQFWCPGQGSDVRHLLYRPPSSGCPSSWRGEGKWWVSKFWFFLLVIIAPIREKTVSVVISEFLLPWQWFVFSSHMQTLSISHRLVFGSPMFGWGVENSSFGCRG